MYKNVFRDVLVHNFLTNKLNKKMTKLIHPKVNQFSHYKKYI